MGSALTTLVAAIALFATTASADVIVVNPSAGDSVQAAVDAAAPGDTLLIQGPGVNPSEVVVINGKGLTLIGEAPLGFPSSFDPAFNLKRMAIDNIPAGQSVSVVHMNVGGPGGDGLILRNNSGALRFVDVSAKGGNGLAENINGQVATPGFTGCFISNCADVVFMRSGILGGLGGSVLSGQGTATSVGGTGMAVQGSTVTIFESGVRGGDGGEVDFIYAPFGSDGGVGAIADDSRVTLNNSTIQGGPGGENDFGGLPSVSGGLGYLQTGASTLATLRDSSFVGGVGVGLSPDGTASNIVGGNLANFPTPIGKLQVDGDSPVREGEPIMLLAQDTTGGTRVFLLTSFSPGHLPLPGREGVLTLGLPLATDLLFIGTSPSVSFLNYFSLGTAPNLPPGFDEVNLFLQSVEITVSGTVTLGTAEHLTILDSSL